VEETTFYYPSAAGGIEPNDTSADKHRWPMINFKQLADGVVLPANGHYRIQGLCRVSQTLGKEHSAKISSAKTSLPSAFCRALGKGFAEC
jgi:hypothetical protein